MTISKDTPFVQTLGRTPSGLFIVTASAEGKHAAYLASFVQQASFAPLVFSIACHPDRYPYELIQKSKKFAINLIPEGDKVLMKTFAKGHGPEENPFENVDFEMIEDVPVLKDAIGGAVFEVTHQIQPGDHAILFGKALDGTYYQQDAKPWVHIRKSALGY